VISGERGGHIQKEFTLEDKTRCEVLVPFATPVKGISVNIMRIGYFFNTFHKIMRLNKLFYVVKRGTEFQTGGGVESDLVPMANVTSSVPISCSYDYLSCPMWHLAHIAANLGFPTGVSLISF
jgi:hypothetical protein